MHRAKHAKKRSGCLTRLLIALLIIVAIFAAAFAAVRTMPARVAQRTPNPSAAPGSTGAPSSDPQETLIDWSVNSDLPTDEWINILLLGSDAGDPEQPGRTDAMIIASINMLNGDLKLTSIMRDTYVPIKGHGSNKITSANWFGGVDLALRTVNEAFGMNITHYAMVDFSSFAYIVDALGGIEMEVSEAEMKGLNQLIRDMRVLYPNIDLPKEELTEFGENIHLDGMQTLAYSRVRKIDSDYQRTSRQREVIGAILKKIASLRDPATMYELLEIGLSYTRTSLSKGDIALLGMKVLTNGIQYEELRLPADGAYKATRIKEMEVLDPDLKKNTAILHEFIYGSDEEESEK